MATLSNVERKRLRQIGHQLQPVVMVSGKGLTENVSLEIERALADHELIKVKVAGEDRELRHQLIQQLAEQSEAEIVHQIGKMVLIFKKANPQNQKLSNLVRFAHLSQ